MGRAISVVVVQEGASETKRDLDDLALEQLGRNGHAVRNLIAT
jgi:hypothetical protein